ncbi:MAG TPA: molybdenum cofactor guanylyltransferase [Candidatus Limnocylindria bacterium]|jgi:molybdopterin-guanine dinucleotide biosynthesis protein A|nr:molybdenum cofactor guanylyltransferase [Candidatus Limnocylindria bacterium]
MRRPSGILLAGGAARRFGRPKLLEPVRGEPLFHHSLRALAAACEEVVVVLAPAAPDPPLPDGSGPVRFVRDPRAHEGPLVGALVGLGEVVGDHAILAGADMPGLRAELLDLMARRLAASGRSAVLLADEDGPRPLPAALATRPALTLAGELVRRGERRLRALVAGLEALVLSESDWSVVDALGEWRRDVDVPEDLPKR